MLAKNNDSKLKRRGVNERVIPFYQIWQELVDRRTLDVYQYRVLTASSALSELYLVIEKTLSGLFTSDANIEACREETLYILNNDPVLPQYNIALLNRLRATIGKNPKTNADKNRLLYQIKYANHYIGENYMHFALAELKSAIVRSDIGAIEQCANIVASQAIYDGWSPHGLLDLLRFFNQDGEFDDQWENFVMELSDTNKAIHHVLISVPFQGQAQESQVEALDALGRLGLNLKTYENIVSEFSTISDISTLVNAEKRYFHVSVDSHDIYAAALLAISQISERLNLASFYNLIYAWDLKSVVIISINARSGYHRPLSAKDLFETHDYLDSSGRIFEKTRIVFTDERKKTIREKLQGSFGYTNISRASLFQEEKYMNLWVALESLARTEMYSDIISNVKETVPAATCLRYIYRIIRNFIEDCKRCKVRYSFSSSSIDMEQETKEKLVKETIAMLRDDTLFSELKEMCKVNSLLYHRTDSIRRLITDVDYAKNKVENHYRRVNWQIQRLYRIRNEIAHAALHEQTSLIVYIEHLYDYLSTYISEIVTYLVDRNFPTMEEALCLIKDNYEAFLAIANSPDNLPIYDGPLASGIINLI